MNIFNLLFGGQYTQRLEAITAATITATAATTTTTTIMAMKSSRKLEPNDLIMTMIT